jgi:photosynthetic reaction center cytochrome c subunit
LFNRFPIAKRTKTVAAALALILVVSAPVTLAQTQGGRTSVRKSQSKPLATPSSEPTGADRCVFCHAEEVQGFARSAMAHGLRHAGQEPDGAVSAHGSTITMHSSPAGFFQTWENGGDRSEYRVDYVIGSGQHASGYLVDIGGHLFQSPVAYYKSRKAYDLAPGYENQPDPDFTRPVAEECVLCHSGTALHVPGTLNEYRTPVFAAEGITCERCHGPVEKHLADPRAKTIIDPAKLEPAARDSVCEQCHLFGVARVPNPGKKLADFTPGAPLENTYTIYRNVMPADSPAADFKVISHVEQLALSACVRNSGGRLWCVTCHNPHEQLIRSPEYYRSRCLSCHTANFPSSHPAKVSDCLGCHMPRRDAKDGGHTVFTDHRIQRKPEMPVDLPANSSIAAWREPAPELRKRNLGIAYIDVGMQRHSSSFVVQGYRALTEVQAQFTNDSDFFKWIGEALLLGKQNSDAKLAFGRALQLDPDSAPTEASAASPFIEEGDDDAAIHHLERAVSLDPLFLPAASTLIGLYEKEGKTAKATDLSSKIKTAMADRPDPGETAANGSMVINRSKHSEDVFKNIRVLKGVPSDQLIPAMQFMASSLGVDCSYCHVQGHFEKDEKKPKETARRMMQMMFTLNSDSFGGKRVVTCYSCHRGSPDPALTPTVQNGTSPDRFETQNLPTNLPTASQLLDRYVAALGGAPAILNISSRVGKGSAEISGKSVSVETYTRSPENWALVRHLPEGDSVAAFNGLAGWFAIPGQPVGDMHPADIKSAKMDADLQFPLHVQRFFPELRVEYPENVGERETYVLFGIKDGRPAANFYFDEQSGLLVRLIRYGDSPLGLNPWQVDYGDYREMDGVQVPFRVTFSEPGNRWTVQFDEIRQNVTIGDAIFTRPTGIL